jgi:hypothetical protein
MHALSPSRPSVRRPLPVVLTPLTAILALVAFAELGRGQTLWTLRSSPTVPPARIDTGITFDSLRGVTVMFGGGNGLVGMFDTWEWDGAAWTERFPTSNPPPRESGRLAFDSARGVTVLFGGYLTGAANDTWEYDGTNWTQHTPGTNPPPRYYHAVAYDAARNETVLCGGYGGGYLGDTWAWNGTTWTQRFPTSSPGARTQMAMAYDATRQCIVAFGGRTSPTSYPTSTWEWNGTNWVERFPATSPPARESHAMAYDSLRQRVILFGGNTAANVRLDDTWEWDGTNWLARPMPVSPAPVRYHGMAFDAARARAVVFGGSTDTGLIATTWEHYHPAPASYTSYGSACPGSNGTPNLAAAPGELPWLGEPFDVVLANMLPVSIAVLAMGFSNSSVGLPLDLGPFGAPSCSLLMSNELWWAYITPGSGTLAATRVLPASVSAVGLHLYDQFAVIDPVVNPLGLVFSNGCDALLAFK